jgi:hypothetical protein
MLSFNRVFGFPVPLACPAERRLTNATQTQKNANTKKAKTKNQKGLAAVDFLKTHLIAFPVFSNSLGSI